MKLIIFISILFISCNESKKAPKEGQTKIVAVYTGANGTKYLDIVLRQISKTIVNEDGKDVIKIDTLWGYPVLTNMRDSLGKVVLDSLKKPKQALGYAVISKDSVNWHVENISTDSLLKSTVK